MSQLFATLTLVLTLTACGGESGETTASGATGGSVATGGTGGGTGGSGAGSGTGGSGADCSSLAEVIAQHTAGNASCTAIVRVAYATHSIVAHAFECGSANAVDESAARAAAAADTGYGDGSLLGGPTPGDEWVFLKTPNDLGGVGVVSARSGLSVFGGSIIWAGTGSLTYPQSWDSASLGSDCPVQTKPNVRGYDLAQAGAVLPDVQVDQAIGIVWNTALPAGIASNSTILDSVVLLYAPEVGYTGPDGSVFDPKTAELVVLVNSGPQQ